MATLGSVPSRTVTDVLLFPKSAGKHKRARTCVHTYGQLVRDKVLSVCMWFEMGWGGVGWGGGQEVLTPGMSFHTFLGRVEGVSWVNLTERRGGGGDTDRGSHHCVKGYI